MTLVEGYLIQNELTLKRHVYIRYMLSIELLQWQL